VTFSWRAVVQLLDEGGNGSTNAKRNAKCEDLSQFLVAFSPKNGAPGIESRRAVADEAIIISA